jgi:hypothetical protein
VSSTAIPKYGVSASLPNACAMVVNTKNAPMKMSVATRKSNSAANPRLPPPARS